MNKDFNSVEDLITRTEGNKSAFVDYLLEYLDGDYHCLDKIAGEEIALYSEWALNYKYLFSLMVLCIIDSRQKKKTDSNVAGFVNSFAKEFGQELKKEWIKFKKTNKKDIKQLLSFTISYFDFSHCEKDKSSFELKKNVNTIDNCDEEREWKLVADLYVDNRIIGREILCFVNPGDGLPVTHRAWPTWKTLKDYRQKYVDLRMVIFKVVDDYKSGRREEILKHIVDFSHRLLVKKDYFAMFASSGKPILSISAIMNVTITQEENCIIENPEWRYEKKWPDGQYEPSEQFFDYP